MWVAYRNTTHYHIKTLRSRCFVRWASHEKSAAGELAVFGKSIARSIRHAKKSKQAATRKHNHVAPACECVMSAHNATLSSGCSKANWRVIANSPHWGLNPGPSVYKTDALPLSYRGFRFDDELVRSRIYFGIAEMPIARRTHFPPRSPEFQGMQKALSPGNNLILSFLPIWNFRH